MNNFLNKFFIDYFFNTFLIFCKVAKRACTFIWGGGVEVTQNGEEVVSEIGGRGGGGAGGGSLNQFPIE